MKNMNDMELEQIEGGTSLEYEAAMIGALAGSGQYGLYDIAKIAAQRLSCWWYG